MPTLLLRKSYTPRVTSTIHQGNHYDRNVTIYNISNRYFDTKL